MPQSKKTSKYIWKLELGITNEEGIKMGWHNILGHYFIYIFFFSVCFSYSNVVLILCFIASRGEVW